MYKILLLALVGAASAQAQTGIGNSVPINQLTAAVCGQDPRTLVADQRSLCWYYQCTARSTGGYALTAKRCALGTFVETNYVATLYNPCSGRFPILGVYDCTRPNTLGVASCTGTLNCTNGATVQQQGSLCWCNCSLDFQGSTDCSVKRGTTPPTPTGGPCPGGAPLSNWCAKALPSGANPCQNGGNCTNQCSNFVCSCPVPYTKDKLCSAFDCSIPPNTCPTGQTCQRGFNGKDEFYTCLAISG